MSCGRGTGRSSARPPRSWTRSPGAAPGSSSAGTAISGRGRPTGTTCSGAWWSAPAAAGATSARERLERSLAEKEVERGRVLSSFRRGKITEAEADRELDDVAKEAALVRQELADLRAREEMGRAADAYFDEAEAMLADLRDELD